MKPLVTNQKVLTWICICPVDKNATKFEKSARIGITSLIVITLFCGFIASVVFFVKFVSIDLEKSLYTVFQIVGTLLILYSFIVLYLFRNEINAIFEHLTEIYDECKLLLNKNRFYQNHIKEINIY